MLIRMLGPFEVGGDDRVVVVAGASQRTILALLALHAGQPVGVAALVDALWPDGPPASARNSLQSHVARLRSALGVPGLIVLEPAGYRLAVSRAQVDVSAFEDLLRDDFVAEALALWRGEPLPEFAGEPFRGIAERLTGLYRTALARRVTLLCSALDSPVGGDGRVVSGGAVTSGEGGEAKRLEEATGELARAAVADPCWERGAVVLATALARTGRRGEAIETLRRHADAVVDRLGLDPSETVRRTQVAVLRGELDPGFSPAEAPRPEPASQAAGVPRDSAGRVPLRFSSFVGREGEQRLLAEMLAEPALVTVVGPGGVGKTRLVAETVRAGARVAWIDAADVSAEDFLEAVAVGVGARIGPLDDPVSVIARAAARFSVVVLDNCEHVVDPAAAVVEAMRGVRVVVTSQERLRVDGERVLVLEPLTQDAAARLFRERAAVGGGARGGGAGRGADGGGGAVGGGVVGGAAAGGEVETVAEIVRRLDRLPLAIELAATQATAIGIAALRDRLDDRLDLLVRGRRTGDARHRTLRALLEWSFGLLDPAGRAVLRRLAVFAGGFTVAQAEAVVADPAMPLGEADVVVADPASPPGRTEPVVADPVARVGVAVPGPVARAGVAVPGPVVPRARVVAVLASLVDRSLVVRHGPGRFRLLETVRQYAAEQPAGDRQAAEARHVAAMVAAAEELDREMHGPEQAAAVRRIDALLPDLRLAFARGDAAARISLAAAMYRYGYHCQQYEVLAWGRAAIGAVGHPRAGLALAAAATHAWGRGDLAEARSLASAGVQAAGELAARAPAGGGRAGEPQAGGVPAGAARVGGAAAHEVLGDVALVLCDGVVAVEHYRAMGGRPVHEVSGLVGEALVLAWSGQVGRAVERAGAAMEIADMCGNPSARAEARYALGECLGDSDPARALDALGEAARIAAGVDDRLFRAAAETAAGAIRSRHGDPVLALSSFREVLDLWRRAGNDTLQAAALRNLIVLLVRVGEDETAVLVDAALPAADVYPAEAARLDRARAAAAERLGQERVASLRRRGRMLSAAQVADEASRSIDGALSRMAVR